MRLIHIIYTYLPTYTPSPLQLRGAQPLLPPFKRRTIALRAATDVITLDHLILINTVRHWNPTPACANPMFILWRRFKPLTVSTINHNYDPPLTSGLGLTLKSGQFRELHAAICCKTPPCPPIGSYMHSRHFSFTAFL